jgi:hypothetical protein
MIAVILGRKENLNTQRNYEIRLQFPTVEEFDSDP